MRNTLALALLTTLTWTGALSTQAAAGGTDILHFMVKTDLLQTPEAPGVTGNLDAKQNKQGGANIQRLKLAVNGLTPNTSYNLVVETSDDTNVVEEAFTTDDQGSAKVEYMTKDNGNGNGKGKGKGKGNGKKQELPPSMNPLSQIKALAIEQVVDTNFVSVAWVDLTDPDQLQYLVKRSMTNTGALPDAEGDLRIKATASSTQFKLDLTGLAANTGYSLSFNDGALAVPFTTDENGEFSFSALPEGSPAVLDIVNMSVLDGLAAPILTTEFPE